MKRFTVIVLGSLALILFSSQSGCEKVVDELLSNCVICKQIERSDAAAVVATSERLCTNSAINEWKRTHPESSFYRVECTAGSDVLKDQEIDSLEVSGLAAIEKLDIETLDKQSKEIRDK